MTESTQADARTATGIMLVLAAGGAPPTQVEVAQISADAHAEERAVVLQLIRHLEGDVGINCTTCRRLLAHIKALLGCRT